MSFKIRNHYYKYIPKGKKTLYKYRVQRAGIVLFFLVILMIVSMEIAMSIIRIYTH